VTRFVAIRLPAYDTWCMRMVLLILALSAAALLPLRADAFDLEENLKAQHVQYEPAAQLIMAQGDGMSLAEAIESVRRKTGGKILSAETHVQGDREVHHIKVLTKDGKVRTHKVNGRRR
jgi:uncharacterized membrane protein YkoI